MRVYQLDRPGSLDGLVLAERDIPPPAAGEVLILQASSINVRDLMILNGEYPMPVPPGRVPLSDGAGEVVAVGAGVRRFKVGDRVINQLLLPELLRQIVHQGVQQVAAPFPSCSVVLSRNFANVTGPTPLRARAGVPIAFLSGTPLRASNSLNRSRTTSTTGLDSSRGH